MKTKKDRRRPRALYFAYGSNLDMGQMANRCPHAVSVGRAVLPDHELTFEGNRSGYGVANIRNKPGSTVPGGVWIISQECLEELDRYEGYPELYTRKTVRVTMPDGRGVLALVYEMTPGHQTKPPADYYLATIMHGYRHFDLSSKDHEALINAADTAARTEAGRKRKEKEAKKESWLKGRVLGRW